MFDIDMDLLISLVETRPVIWDKANSYHKDRNVTKKAWNEINAELRFDYDELNEEEKAYFGKYVMKKWINARDCFRKSCKKQKLLASSSTTIKKYIYSEQLQFLTKVYPHDQSDDPFEDGDTLDLSVEGDDDRDFKNNPLTKRRKLENNTETQMIELPNSNPDRHLSFFNSVIPSLNSFDDDETLEFQMEVLRAITSIKKRRRKQNSENCFCMSIKGEDDS